jgi:hypothetical protein
MRNRESEKLEKRGKAGMQDCGKEREIGKTGRKTEKREVAN